jgi:hypothetical protein
LALIRPSANLKTLFPEVVLICDWFGALFVPMS